MKIFGIGMKEFWGLNSKSLAHRELYNNIWIPVIISVMMLVLLGENVIAWVREGYSGPLHQRLMLIVENLVLLGIYWRIVANVLSDKAFSMNNVKLIKAAGLSLVVCYLAISFYYHYFDNRNMADSVDSLTLVTFFTVAYFIYLLGSIIRIGIRIKAENDLTI